MNSLVSILSTLVSVFLFALLMAVLTRSRKAEEENKILWEQIHRYDEILNARASEDEERQRLAIRN